MPNLRAVVLALVHAAIPALAVDGNLYGTTSERGPGGGTLYRVPAGGDAAVTLHRFIHQPVRHVHRTTTEAAPCVSLV